MSAVYYECAACDARFSMIMPDSAAQSQSCIHCFAKGAHLVCREGEQEGDLHRFPSHATILNGSISGGVRKPRRRRLK